jgi:ATP-dependent exoDNAse (exonuclease V) alpha subunit
LSRHRFEKLYGRALKEAIRNAHNDQAHFTVRSVLQKVLEKLEHTGFHPRHVLKRLDRSLQQNRDLVHLQDEGFNRVLTTRKMWQLEEKLLADCATMRGRDGVRVSDSKLERVLTQHAELSTEQVEAVRDLTQRKGALRLLQGVAGAGKSRTLDAVREAFEKSGYRVLGGAISGIAKQNLAEQAKIESRTIASYLYHLDRSVGRKICDRLVHDLKQLVRAAVDKPTSGYRPLKLTRRTVLILDEAGMNDTKSFARLVRLVKKAGATLILVGDSKQLQPIGPGGVFPHLLHKYDHPTLKNNRRQQKPEDRKAVEQLRMGNSREAIDSYHSRGLLKRSPDHLSAARELIESWVTAGGVQVPKDHSILVQTRKEAQVLNLAAQSERKRAGELDSKQTLRLGETTFHVRDRVMFHKRLASLHIENGHQGEILRICPLRQTVHVRLDQPKPGTPAVVGIPLKLFQSAQTTLGYAATTHKFQGATTEFAYVLMGGSAIDRNMAYTQMTRARQRTQLFVSDAAAGDHFENLIRSTAKERPKKLAHDLDQRIG